MPGPLDAMTSVFRQQTHPLPAIWELGDREIGLERRVRAAAILTAAQVRHAMLDVQAHEPPPRHANIVGWPTAPGDPDAIRARRKEFALLLVHAATLVRRA